MGVRDLSISVRLSIKRGRSSSKHTFALRFTSFVTELRLFQVAFHREKNALLRLYQALRFVGVLGQVDND